jgi:tetratricopeptide (TPR) repeat protein
MTRPFQSQLDDIVRDFRERRFNAAAEKAEAVLGAAAKTSPDELLAVSRFLSQGFKLDPHFGHTSETVGADALPLRVMNVVAELFGPDHLQVTAARNRLAATYATQGRAKESAVMWEQSLAYMLRALPADHPAIQLARNNLALLYRNLGRSGDSEKLYATLQVCEHLRPVKDYIVANGGKITFAGQAWSNNCRLWVYFDVILDAAALKDRFALPDCVAVHEHRGKFDGAEQGLVCNAHQDAVMGPHSGQSGAKVIA